MEDNNDNSGKARCSDFQGQETKFDPKVKGVGQECPTHTQPHGRDLLAGGG